MDIDDGIGKGGRGMPCELERRVALIDLKGGGDAALEELRAMAADHGIEVEFERIDPVDRGMPTRMPLKKVYIGDGRNGAATVETIAEELCMKGLADEVREEQAGKRRARGWNRASFREENRRQRTRMLQLSKGRR